MKEKEYQLRLDGVTCAKCINSVKKILDDPQSKIEGLYSRSLNLETKILTLIFDADTLALSDRELEEKLKDSLFAYDPQSFMRRESHWAKGFLGLAMGVGFSLLMVFGHIPFIGMIMMVSFGTLTSLYLGWHSSKLAMQKMYYHGALTMDVLFMVSALAAIAISIAHLFVPGLPLMIDAALLIFGFRHIGQAIEHHIRQKITKRVQFKDLLSTQYSIVGADKPCLKENLKPGMTVVLQPGEMLPLDGFCMSDGLVDASNITGEARLLLQKGQHLRSGVVALGEKPIHIEISADQEYSFIYQYDHILDADDEFKSSIEQQADKIIHYFLPTVMIIAIMAGLIVSAFFPWLRAVQTTLYILVSACPCVFGMITPLALYVGMMKSSTQGGVTFNTRGGFERASEINAVVFDIFGTLTENNLKLIGESTVSARYFPLIAAMEKDAKHLIGEFIYEYASEHSAMVLRLDKDTVKSDPKGKGVSAEYGGHCYMLGSADYVRAAVGEIPPTELPRTYFVEDGKIKGYFDIEDPLRKGAFDTIQTLDAMGTPSYLCTGMSRDAALYYAKQLKIPAERVFAGCKPFDIICKGGYEGTPIMPLDSKISVIEYLKQQGLRVAMVGDGGNDAAALQESDVGIAVTSRVSNTISDEKLDRIVKQKADAILNDIRFLIAIPAAFLYSKRTMTHIQHNLLFSIGYNMASLVFVGCALVYFSGHLNPAYGVAIMFLQTVLVLGNTFLFKLSHEGELPQALSAYPHQCRGGLTPQAYPPSASEAKPQHGLTPQAYPPSASEAKPRHGLTPSAYPPSAKHQLRAFKIQS